MTIVELKDQIMKNSLKNFYIFTGDEIGIMNIYLQQMSNKLSMPISRVDSVLSIYTRLSAKSMFGSTTGFYVIRDDKDIMKDEKVYQNLQNVIGKNVIVLLYDKVDSRLKFGKFFKDNIVAFEKLTPTILKSYVKKEINLSDKNAETLIELCNGSYDMCMLEIDKVKQFQENSRDLAGSVYTADYSFSYLLNSGAIYQPEERDVFKFVDCVCNHKANQAFEAERILRESGTSSINILGTLYNTLKSVMLIQCCEGSNICDVTGLDNRQVYFNKKYVGKYKTEKLVAGVKLVAKAIDDVKSGRLDDVYATRYVLVQFM